MSRRFVVLALVAAAAVTAGGALAKPPSPQPDPELILPGVPPLASLCQTPGSYPHPIASCSAVQVSCPSTAKAQFACKTMASTGPAGANTRKLEFVLPKRYSALTLLCKTQTGIDVACRVSSRTSVKASGLRVSVVKLPNRVASLHIACSASKSAFACRIKN
jgi:hypothetical protein